MKLLPHTRQFIQGCTNAIVPVIKALGPSDDLGENLMQTLLGKPETPYTPPPMTRDQQFAVKMFRDFGEIHTCIERLKDFETYVSRFPFGRTRITRDAYLQMVVEGHLHDLYLLKERLIAFAKRIARAYKRDSDSKRIARGAMALEEFVLKALGRFIKVRGNHVHVKRYTHADIDRLRLISILQKDPDKDFTQAIRYVKRHATTESHNRLKVQAKSWNTTASRVPEEYCKVASSLLFVEGTQSFRYPAWKK